MKGGEELSNGRKWRYGVILQNAAGNKVPLSVLAHSITMNSSSGQLELNGYRGDSLNKQKDDLVLQFVAEDVEDSGARKVSRKFISQPIPVKVLSDDHKPTDGNHCCVCLQ